MDRQIGWSEMTRSRNDSNPACISTNRQSYLNPTILEEGRAEQRGVRKAKNATPLFVLNNSEVFSQYADHFVDKQSSACLEFLCASAGAWSNINTGIKSKLSGSNLSYQPLGHHVETPTLALFSIGKKKNSGTKRRMLVFLFPRPPSRSPEAEPRGGDSLLGSIGVWVRLGSFSPSLYNSRVLGAAFFDMKAERRVRRPVTQIIAPIGFPAAPAE